LNSPKPIHLWSSPRPEPNSSNSVGRKVSKLDLNQSLSNESISNGSGYISKVSFFRKNRFLSKKLCPNGLLVISRLS